MAIPKVLVIAGSDSSGGAGLEADQKVLAAHACYATTATTALTAQNTLGVQDVHVTPPSFLAKQINACLADIGADVVKMGMVASAETINVIADTLGLYKVAQIVLDPVMVSTSGHQLLPRDAIQTLRKRLLPMTTVLTPNIPEATLLLRDADVHFKNPDSLEDIKAVAKLVHDLGANAVLLKGGHMPLTKSYSKPKREEVPTLMVDVLYDGTDYMTIETDYLQSKNTHGTGCSLASAIAANLALGQNLRRAVRNACQYVEAAIKTALNLGAGSGPINHFHPVQIIPFAKGRFIEYLLGRPDVEHLWHEYTHHDFVEKLARGTLPMDIFKNFLVQDYLYLVHFARTNALAAYKSKAIDMISASAQIVLHIEREMSLHLDYCKQFGLSKEDIEARKETQACLAYSRYVLDIGQSEDWLALQMALAPCLLGYGAAARRLYADQDSIREGNPLWKWVENYVEEDYQQAVKTGSGNLIPFLKHIFQQSPSRIEELIKIFVQATEMEVAFWDMRAHDQIE